MKVITTGAEAKLVETLSMLKNDPDNWDAVAFFFDRLLEHYRNDYQIKIAINLITDLLKEYEATIFQFRDTQMFLVSRDVPEELLEKVIFQLRYLFMDDPLAYTGDGEENPEFSQIFNLKEDLRDILSYAQARMLGKDKPAAKASGAPKAAAKKPASSTLLTSAKRDAQDKEDIKYFDASQLASIEKNLHNADLSTVIRRQPICAAIPNMMVRRVFDELYINIAHLRQLLRVDVDLLSNRWLFKYLTEILDERMLHMIMHSPARYLELPISLNLNIRTLMSDFFAEFDASVKPSVKVSVVIELQVADVFDDMQTFLTARDMVQKMGYRVCLDGVTNLSFTQIDREKLGFDLVKLQWNADFTSDLKTHENKQIADVVKACGANRVILTRCDNRKAVDFGQALGISLFQGRYLDKLMNPLSKVEN